MHDHGQNPQAYIDDFFCKASNKLFGIEKLVNVVCVQGPVILEENDKGRRCAWNLAGQDLVQSQGYQYVQQIVEREIGQMGGRADKLFIMGTGVGGHLALLTAFYSQHVFGGVFCCDAIMPDGLVTGATGGEGGAIYPNFEAKKNMFICVTKWKGKISEADVEKAKQ